MDRKEFQQLAVRTESLVDVLEISEADMIILTKVLESFISASEVLDIYKKHLFYGRPINYNVLGSHLDDMLSTTNKADKVALNQMLYSVQSPQTTIDLNVRLFHALLGTITEHGELGIALKEGLSTGKLDLVNICEELGDSDWYKALFYEATGIDWETVQAMIIKKLEIRFQDTIFKEGEANERDLVAERELMEKMITDQIDLFEG